MRLIPVLAFTLALAGGSAAAAQDAAGDWLGKVTIPTGETLTITAHLAQGADGAWQGTAGSPDQTLAPLPMTDIKVGGEQLSFAAPSVNAAYKGRWDPAAHAWVGTLTQGAFDMPLTLARGVPGPRPVVAGLDGHWTGLLVTPGGDLHLVLDVKTDAAGTLGLFQSPDQAPVKMVAGLSRKGDAVSVELKGVGGFDATLSADGATLDGHWKQGGGSLPLKMTRGG